MNRLTKKKTLNEILAAYDRHYPFPIPSRIHPPCLSPADGCNPHQIGARIPSPQVAATDPVLLYDGR